MDCSVTSVLTAPAEVQLRALDDGPDVAAPVGGHVTRTLGSTGAGVGLGVGVGKGCGAGGGDMIACGPVDAADGANAAPRVEQPVATRTTVAAIANRVDRLILSRT